MRLKEEDDFGKEKWGKWEELEEKEKMFNEVNELIHRQYERNIEKKEGFLF